jgi:hypothetical protein
MDLNLKTLIKCLIDHYAFNECAHELRLIEDALREMACEANDEATAIEDRKGWQRKT